MGDSKKIILKIIADFLLLCLIGFPILIVELIAVPHKQGFFCDDQSLKKPFYEISTIPDGTMIAYSVGIPVIVILIIELIDSKFNKNHIKRKLTIGEWKVPLWLQNSYRHIGFFIFGALCAQMTTHMMKFSMGRLRPHFFDLCKPSVDCFSPENIGKFITIYSCSGNEDSHYLREMRLSFPSGHSSFTGFALVYCALYLQVRMTWNGSALFKHVMQFLLILLTWWTGLSRVLDHKHHWTDVLAGFVLGISYAFLVAKFVSKLFDKKMSQEILPVVRYDLGEPTSS